MTRTLAFLLAGATLAWAQTDEPRAVKEPSVQGPRSSVNDDGYVIILTGGDTTPRRVLQRYPEITASWQDISELNLLRPGTAIEVTRDMLRKDEALSKIVDSFGEAEVRRSFDPRFIPVVKNLLVREGDVLRTWRRSGARLAFEDGSYAFLRSNSKIRVVTLGSTVSKTELALVEGSIDCRVKKGGRDKFEIQTPTASTLIRGTDFRLKVESDDRTRLEVLDGEVELQSSGGAVVSVPARHGALTLRGNPPGRPEALLNAPDVLREPQDKEVLRASSFEKRFAWSPVPGAVSYRLEVSRDESFFDLAFDEFVNGVETTLRNPDLEPGTYFWRVSAVEAGGFEGLYSGRAFFVFVKARP